jgi:hypothetical protein
MSEQPTQITLNRDQLAALLAHHADVLAAQLRTEPARDNWIAAARLDAHAAALTAEEESPAVAELLDSMLAFPGVDGVVGMPSAPAAEACGKCRQPFDPDDTRFDGHARYHLTPYCRSCVDRCHDTEIADHQCVICRTAEATR